MQHQPKLLQQRRRMARNSSWRLVGMVRFRVEGLRLSSGTSTTSTRIVTGEPEEAKRRDKTPRRLKTTPLRHDCEYPPECCSTSRGVTHSCGVENPKRRGTNATNDTGKMCSCCVCLLGSRKASAAGGSERVVLFLAYRPFTASSPACSWEYKAYE